jgi:amino acid transporter
MDLKRLRDIIIGAPLRTLEYGERQLNKMRALAALSPDSLSSIAYANQEIYLALATAGAIGLSMAFPITLAIILILIIVTLSYYQTIYGYPSGGGSYTVARENLGEKAGLVAAMALVVDYILVVAVSLTAGVEAIGSAFPALLPYRIEVSLLILIVLVILNLRGAREAGTVIAIPVYLFLFTYIPMLVYGAWIAVIEGPGNLVAVAPPALEPLTLVLLLHAFSSGCTALTGIEAISNAVPAFEEPKSKNAGKTLIAMSFLVGLLFVGSTGLTQYLAVIPLGHETILSALSHRILGEGPLYVLIQLSTLLILAVAANTSFTGFPRVTALLAKDSYIARQLSNLGDRLVFNNGILLLSAIAALLIIAFNGQSHPLVPLFAVGAFLSFTLSQAGMVIHWWKIRGRYWQWKSLINGVGSFTTLSALAIIGISKFVDGAWMTFIIIPIGVIAFMRIRQYYREFDIQMSPIAIEHLPRLGRSLERAAIPVSHINQGTVDAVVLASRIARDVIAVHVEVTEGSGAPLEAEWKSLWPNIPFFIVPSPYRSVTEPLIEFLEKSDMMNSWEPTAVVLPAFVTEKWWQVVLHNQTTWWIRQAVLEANRISGIERAIIEVPHLLQHRDFNPTPLFNNGTDLKSTN